MTDSSKRRALEVGIVIALCVTILMFTNSCMQVPTNRDIYDKQVQYDNEPDPVKKAAIKKEINALTTNLERNDGIMGMITPFINGKLPFVGTAAMGIYTYFTRRKSGLRDIDLASTMKGIDSFVTDHPEIKDALYTALSIEQTAAGSKERIVIAKENLRNPAKGKI